MCSGYEILLWNMTKIIKQIIITAAVMLTLDMMYLSTFSNFFGNIIRNIQNSEVKFNMLGAIACYIFLIVGLNYFIISNKKSVFDAFVLGIVIYGVYETTNYTLFSGWPIEAVMLDTIWGGILFALTTYIYHGLFL